jgi:hypothetical protein
MTPRATDTAAEALVTGSGEDAGGPGRERAIST